MVVTKKVNKKIVEQLLNFNNIIMKNKQIILPGNRSGEGIVREHMTMYCNGCATGSVLI